MYISDYCLKVERWRNLKSSSYFDDNTMHYKTVVSLSFTLSQKILKVLNKPIVLPYQS